MAITKRPNGKFQTKIQGLDGQWISRTFTSHKEAEAYDFYLKSQMRQGTVTTNSARSLTCDEFFPQWFETVRSRASKGWRKEQVRMFKTYVSPILGGHRLDAISPQVVARVLNEMAALGKSEQTQCHVFNLMRKLFGDAIEMFRLITYNPAQRSLKPKVPVKESPHLSLAQVKALLQYSEETTYGVAIWLQLYMGLRVGEVQALTWENVDLEEGILTIRNTYLRKEHRIKEYPKGGKQHSHRIPLELLNLLSSARKGAKSAFVAPSPTGEMLSYEWYFRTLRKYCKACGISKVGTHGLRHSTSQLYLTNGASRDDIRQLFAHSSMAVTERYIHHQGTNLEMVAKRMLLFSGSSQNLAKLEAGRCK